MTIQSENPDYKPKGEVIYGAMSAEATEIPTATAYAVTGVEQESAKSPPVATNEDKKPLPETCRVFVEPKFTKLGRSPQTVICPHCQEKMLTKTKKKVGGVAVASSAITCLVFWPLFWVPLVCTDCQSVVHRCSKCDRHIGRADPFARDVAQA